MMVDAVWEHVFVPEHERAMRGKAPDWGADIREGGGNGDLRG